MSEVVQFPRAGRPMPAPPKAAPATPQLIEPSQAPEIFCSEAAKLDDFGSFARLIFAVEDRSLYDGEGAQRIVQVKIVMPPAAILALYKMLGEHLAAGEGRLCRLIT